MTTTSHRPISALIAGALALTAWLAPVGAASAAAPDQGSRGVHTYTATPGDLASDRFTLSAEGTDVFVAAYTNRSNNRMHVARFASADADPTLTVTSTTPITSWSIYPERLYPADAVHVEGSTLTFTMSDSLRYAIVRVNGADPGLAIINDPPEDPAGIPDPEAANVVDLADFVTDSTGATDQTAQVTAAIDALYDDAAKDTLYVPDGWYQYAGLELRNRTKPVTIYVSEGALLKNRIQPAMTSMEPAIGIWDSANITISGRGVFDGNGFANYDTANGGWRHDANTSHHQGGVMVVRSHDIVFNDTLMRDAKQWNWETHTASDITFNNIKGLTPYAQPWIDGLDFASGQRLTVNGALTLGNDDTFASGHYNPDDGFVDDVLNPDRLTWDTADSSEITINDHLGWSAGGGNGIRLGHSAYGHQMKDYTFSNVHYLGFSGGDNAITVQNSPDSGVRNYPRYESLTIRDSSFDTSKVAHNATILGKSSTDPADRIGSVVLDDVWFSQEKPSRIENVTALTIRDLTVAGARVTRSTQTALTFSNVLHRDLDFPEDVAPVLTVTGEPTVLVGQQLTLHASAQDGDGDAVTLSLADPGLPAGAHFDPASGALTWSPTPADAGQVAITFVATDARGATDTVTVTVTVTDPDATVLALVAAADTSVQTWNTEQSISYGDNEHLRMLNFNNSARGRLGELYTGGQTGQDAKLTYLSFGLDELAADLDAGATIASARLSLTYFGPTKGALTGTSTLLAARAATGWTAGDGKTTPPARSSTVAGAMTWLTKAAVDTSLVVESDPFDVTSASKVGADATYSGTQAPIGSVASLDVTALLAAALSDGDADLSVALNETKKQDIIFVSTEGAARNPTAAGMAPTLTVTLRQAPSVDLSALRDALEAAQGLAPASYSAESWAPFTQSVARADAVLADGAADQQSVDAAVAQLAAARASLAAAVTTITAVTDGTPVATGDALDPATVTVEATFTDGSTAVLAPADWQVTGLDTTSAGDKSVTVSTREQMTATGAPPAQATLVVSVLDAWSPAQTYLGAERVVMDGSIWSATWWTRGQQPGDPYGPWQELRTNPDGSTAWTPSRIFTAGDVVVHDGITYVAQWWTRNQQPGQPFGPWVRVS